MSFAAAAALIPVASDALGVLVSVIGTISRSIDDDGDLTPEEIQEARNRVAASAARADAALDNLRAAIEAKKAQG